MYETSCQSRFDARYWMLGAGVSPLGRPRMEVDAQGAVYRIIGNALRTHPLL